IQVAEFRLDFPISPVFFCSFLDSVYLSLQELSQVWGEARWPQSFPGDCFLIGDRKSTRLNSSHVKISYAVFCLKKKKKKTETRDSTGRNGARDTLVDERWADHIEESSRKGGVGTAARTEH